jgi:hypothetical protein
MRFNPPDRTGGILASNFTPPKSALCRQATRHAGKAPLKLHVEIASEPTMIFTHN